MLSKRQQEVWDLRQTGISLSQVAEKLNMNLHTCRATYYQAKKNVEKMDDVRKNHQIDKYITDIDSLPEAMEEKARMIVQNITEDSIKMAPLNQKASAIEYLIRNSRLLKGEATQIISRDDSKALKDLIPALVKEAQRRGLSLELSKDVSEAT